MKAKKRGNQKGPLDAIGGVRRFFLHISFCLLTGLTSIYPSYATAEFWTVGTPLSLGSKLSGEPAICAQGENIFVAWSDNRLGRWEIFFRYSHDGGVTWQREERVTRSSTDSVQPAIACDRRHVHLVWLESSPTGTQCRYKSWDGRNWSPPRTLSRQGTSVRRPKIGATTTTLGNWITAVWEGQAESPDSNGALTRRTRTTAFITHSRDRGQTWLQPQPITPGSWDTSEPNVAGGLQSVYVTWRDGREASSQIYVKRWDESTASDELRLSSIGACRRPSVAVLEPHVHVAWECRLSEIAPANVFATESADAGETWATTQQISANTAESIAPQILAGRDDAWIVWQDGGELGNWEVRVASRLAQGSEQFTDKEGISTFPAIAKSGSAPAEQLHLVWVNRSSSAASGGDVDTATIFYRRRDTIPPTRPAQPVHLDSEARPGFDNDSRLTFSWETPEQPAFPFANGVQYHIFVSINGADFTEIDSTNQSIFEFDSEDNKRYRVVIQASDAVGNRSEFSEPSLPVFVDRQPPFVQIHLPNPDTTITRPISVIGTCVDSNLVECRLRFGRTTSPQTWTLLRQPIPIQFERERLTVWDTSNLSGIYTLALTAVDKAGNRATTTIPLIIDNRPPLPLASSGSAIPLIDLAAEVFFRTPVWSPDGQKIAFSSNEGGAVDIWTLDLRDSSRRRLTRDMAVDLNPGWHPDSKRLIFQSRRPAESGTSETEMNADRRGLWEIWTIQSDGGDHRTLILLDDVQLNSPPIMTGRVTSLSHVGEGLVTPSWSPTGDQIAFAADVDGDLEIWVVRNAAAVLSGDQAQVVQLTRNRNQDLYPAWAPDGSQIAFQSDRNGNWEIGLIDIDGSSEMLLHQSVANETRPAWSPDGKSILFLSDQGEDLQLPHVLNLRDGQITQISPIGGGGQSFAFPQFVNSADWSPDGKAIVYQSSDLLYTMAFEFPEPTIEARLERPVDGEQVHGKVNLFGIARGELFQEYRLEYTSISVPDKWRRIGGKSTTPVTPEPASVKNYSPFAGGFMGQWDSRQFRGAYVLRLVVVSATGDEIEDRVKVFVENEHPRLEILYPPEGLRTTERLITVSGRVDKRSTVTLNNAMVRTDEEGGFETQLLLQEAENRIEIKAANPIGLETNVYRNVFWADRSPGIIIDSPQDFAILDVPYVTVSGQVSTAEIQLLINSVVIPLQSNRRFSRTLLLQAEEPRHLGGGENLIRVETVNRLGRRTEVQRRVIYEPKVDIRNDVNPPGIAAVFPPDGEVLPQTDTKITAILIDDVEIAPSTIQFSFDGEEYVFDGTEEAAIFDGKTFDFNPQTGQFTYIPPLELVNGLHTFKLEVQDTGGNSAQGVDFKFFIDTQPFNAVISAKRTGDVLKVFVDTNKRLTVIPSAKILPSGSSLGYTLNLEMSYVDAPVTEPAVVKDFLSFRYEGDFRTVPSQTGFTLSAAVQPPQYGKDFQLDSNLVSLVGYFTDQNQFPEIPPTPLPQSIAEQASRLTAFHLFIDDGPSVVLFRESAEPDFKATLRSQGGLDQSLVLAQNQNAIERRLTILQPVYMIEADVEKEDTLLWITLPIPQYGPVLDFSHLSPTMQGVQSNGIEVMENVEHLILFWWDPRGGGWIPLDTTTNQFDTLEAVGHQFGSYALLTEQEPPIIRSIRPDDGDEVPLNRFLVEAEITDEGSGVDSVQLRVDDLPVQFHYERDTGRLTYVPSDLNAGKHTLELTVTDRANNSVRRHQSFFTSDIFDFADEITVYPNPASHEVNIRFNLTQSADVTLKVYDTAGQLVQTVNWGGVTGKVPGSGNEKFIWNCENQAGETVASGVYIYVLEATRGEQTVSRSGKFAVVR